MDDKLQEIVKEAIEPKLEEARMIGVMIGWQACCQRMYEESKNLHSVKAVRKYLKDYADNMQARLEEMSKKQEENQG